MTYILTFSYIYKIDKRVFLKPFSLYKNQPFHQCDKKRTGIINLFSEFFSRYLHRLIYSRIPLIPCCCNGLPDGESCGKSRHFIKRF